MSNYEIDLRDQVIHPNEKTLLRVAIPVVDLVGLAADVPLITVDDAFGGYYDRLIVTGDRLGRRDHRFEPHPDFPPGGLVEVRNRVMVHYQVVAHDPIAEYRNRERQLTYNDRGDYRDHIARLGQLA